MYEQKLALSFGLQKGYSYTKEWFDLIKTSFQLSDEFADFSYRYGYLKTFGGRLEVNIHKLDQHMLDNESRWRSLPTFLPTRGWITSYFGPRVSPIDKRTKMHEGIDIGAVPGTPIFSPADGIATYTGDKPGFGKFVQINHGYGIETLYAHAKKLHIKKRKFD